MRFAVSMTHGISVGVDIGGSGFALAVVMYTHAHIRCSFWLNFQPIGMEDLNNEILFKLIVF